MPTITDYLILDGKDARSLVTAVTSHLATGWQPYGSPLVVKGGLAQPMVRSRQRTVRLRKTSENGRET